MGCDVEAVGRGVFRLAFVQHRSRQRYGTLDSICRRKRLLANSLRNIATKEDKAFLRAEAVEMGHFTQELELRDPKDETPRRLRSCGLCSTRLESRAGFWVLTVKHL